MNGCSACRGEGIVTERHEGTIYLVPCVDCNGMGSNPTPAPTADHAYGTCVQCGKPKNILERPYTSCRECNGLPPHPPVRDVRYPVKQAASVAALALALLTSQHASAAELPVPVPAGCVIVGTTGPDEGFPVAHCADGSYLYSDLDGSDGSRGTVGDGRWLDATGYVLYQAH